MKIAFIAHRANYLKHYGPIVDAALGRDWQVEMWLHETDLGGGKDYLRITPQMVEEIWGDQVKTRSFANKEEVKNLQAIGKTDALVSLHPRNYYSNEMDRRGQFITLQHSVDTFVWNTPNDLATSDHVCLFTPFWWGYAERYYELAGGLKPDDWAGTLRDKVVYTGFAQMDAFAKIDKNEVRRRWSIPSEKPVVLLLPIDLAGWTGPWPSFFVAERGRKQWRALARGGTSFVAKYWQWALKGWNDKALTETIKEFSDRNSAFLLAKGREKDPLRNALLNSADKVLYDETHYVPTIFEAIAIASVVILFYSTAAQEAAYAGVPTICVDRPNKDLVKHRMWRSGKTDGPYNYPGVVSWKTIPETITDLPDQSLDNFRVDDTARQEYLLKYNGPADHKASRRILDLVSQEGSK